MVLLLFVIASVGCGPEPGRLSLSLAWRDEPSGIVYLWVRVEAREDVAAPGSALASVGPHEYEVGSKLSLSLDDVPNGDNLVVVAEVREEPNAGLPILYYGVSAPFSLAPGQDAHVETLLELHEPRSDQQIATVELVFSGVSPDIVNVDSARNSTVRIFAASIIGAVLANDASFSAGLTSFAFDGTDDRAKCTETNTDGLLWRDCLISGWDLLAELPDGTAGNRTVYVRFIDTLGYESRVYSATVMVDSQPPFLVSTALSNEAAGAGQSAVLSLSFQEPLSTSTPPVLSVLSASLGGAEFLGPKQEPGTATYSWTATVANAEVDDTDTYTFSVVATDAVENPSVQLPVEDGDGNDLTFRQDGHPPELLDANSIVKDPPEFGLNDWGKLLTFDFVFEELNLPECPGVGCPVVLLGDPPVVVGAVWPLPDESDSGAGREAFRFEYEFDPDHWGPIDRELPITIAWQDLMNNETVETLAQAVDVDLIEPTALNCILTPPLANKDSVLLYTITASEPLSFSPVISVVEGPDGLFSQPPIPSADGLTFSWQQPVSGLPEGKIAVAATLVDEALNGSPGPVCQRSAMVDSSAPVLLLGTVATVPEVYYGGDLGLPVAGDEATIVASFTVSAPEGFAEGFPKVDLMAGGTMLPFLATDAMEESPGHFSLIYQLPVLESLHKPHEGYWPVRVQLRDPAGNDYFEEALGQAQVRLDFTAPALLNANLFLSPPSESLLQSVSSVTNGTGVELIFTVDEELASPPQVEAKLNGNVIAFGVPQEASGHTYSYGLEIDGLTDADDVQGKYTVTALTEDLAGNEAALEVDKIIPFLVDSQIPSGLSLSSQSGVRLVRHPWGSEDGGPGSVFAVRGCATPGTVPQPYPWCDGETYKQAVEPAATVTIYQAVGENGESVCSDILLGKGVAGNDGSFALKLPGDVQAVCLVQTDSAGNSSTASQVGMVEWVAGFHGKSEGDSDTNSSAAAGIATFQEDWFPPPSTLSSEGLSQVGLDGLAIRGDGLTTEVVANAGWRDLSVRIYQPPSHSLKNGTACFDPMAGGVLIFGSDDSTYGNQTWLWDGVSWTLLTPTSSPSSRRDSVMAWDGGRGNVLLFGGKMQGPGGAPYSQETWSWDGLTWQKLYPEQSPPPRSEAKMAYDPLRDKLLLYGGQGDSGITADFWSWDGATWSEEPAGGPPHELHALSGMAYNPADGRVYVLGKHISGEDDEGGDTAELWAWDGASWSLAWTADMSLAPGSSMTWLPDPEGLHVMGSDGPLRFDGNGWEPSATEGIAAAQTFNGPLVYDYHRGRPVLVRHNSASCSCLEVVEWSGGNWYSIETNLPTYTSGNLQSAAYSAVDEGIVFAGLNYTGQLEYLLAHGEWSEFGSYAKTHTVVSSYPLDYISRMVCESKGYDYDGTFLPRVASYGLYGGPEFSDWDHYGFLEMGISSPGCGLLAQFPASEQATVFRGGRHAALLGTAGCGSYFHSHQLLYQPKSAQVAAYDTLRERLVVLGSPPSTWFWDGASWAWREATGDVEPISFSNKASLAYDEARDRVVLLSDYGTAEFDGETWHELWLPSALKDGNYTIAYDPGIHSTLALGGDGIKTASSGTYYKPEIWQYGPANHRPHLMLSVGAGAAGTLHPTTQDPAPKELLSIDITGRASGESHTMGSGHFDGLARAGYEVYVHTANAEPWLLLHASPGTSSPDFALHHLASWTAADDDNGASSIDHWAAPDANIVFDITSLFSTGASASAARVEVDFFEVKLVYARQPLCDPADVCCGADGYWANGMPCESPEDPCIAGSFCLAGKCGKMVGCGQLCVAGGCDDGNPCTIDECVPTEGCVYSPVPDQCMPGDSRCRGRILDSCAAFGEGTTCLLWGDGEECPEHAGCAEAEPGIASCDCLHSSCGDNCCPADNGPVDWVCADGACCQRSCGAGPMCSGAFCGDDGCGGKCECPPGRACQWGDEGECVKKQGVCGAAGVVCSGWSACQNGNCVSTNCTESICAIPEGEFFMGCNPWKASECTGLTGHFVWLDAYSIDQYEVTVADYSVCVDDGICTVPIDDDPRCNWGEEERNDHPVNSVTWNQAHDYCQWAKGRLCSEAEWEKAARGADGRVYPWGDNWYDCYNGISPYYVAFDVDSTATEPVGTKESGVSAWGCHNMPSNVSEWVWDYYDNYAYFRPWATEPNPLGPAEPTNGDYRVVRGGSRFTGDCSYNPYSNWLLSAQTAFRGQRGEQDARPETGFRCCY